MISKHAVILAFSKIYIYYDIIYIYGQERINFLTNIKAIKKPQLINFHQTKESRAANIAILTGFTLFF